MKCENELLKEWKERLGLHDWVITLRYNCKSSDMELGKNVAGETYWINTNKTASIKIVSKETYGDRIIKYDFERILVHELLHVKFQYLQIEKDEYESKVFEEIQHQLIEDLAQSLVMAKRGITDRAKYNIDCAIVKEVKQYECKSKYK